MGAPRRASGRGADDAAEPAELEFGEDFDDEDAGAVEVVHEQLADRWCRPRRRGCPASWSSLTMASTWALFAGGEVEHFLCVLEEDGALGLGLGDVDGARVDADFGLGDFLDGALRLAAKDHAPHDAALVQAAAHDLDHADVVHVEIARVLGEDSEDCFSHQLRQRVLVACLLRTDHATQRAREVLGLPYLAHSVNLKLLQRVECDLLCQFVAAHNVRCLEAHAQQLFSFLEKLPARMMTRFVASPISASCCCEAMTSSLAAGWTTSSSRRMVTASLVRMSFCRWLTTILLRPKGPNEVATVLLMVRQASMLRRTAPSSAS